jgi:acyl-CoA synthetase (AMP-forming)/AMP-acid ligase II
MASALAMAECLDIRSDDVSALIFPFTHIGGIGWLMAALFTGCRLLTTEAFDPSTTPAFLAANDVTLAGSGTPFHMAYLAAQRAKGGDTIFPRIRSYPGGGAPKPPQLHHDLKREIGGVGIVSGYGLTEAPIVVMATTHDPDGKLADTEGRPTPGVELIVVGLDGRRAGPGDEGEIRLKGPQVIQGYLDPSLDADAFDEQGYFRSGDLGIVDADGYVTITGRLKDVIIRHGENISAKEVEDLLYSHPSVADVAVIGLPDPKTGERACAVVAVREGQSLSFADMVAYLKDQGLRVQAVPEQLELVAAVPRNPAGKILKHTLRERFAPTPQTGSPS